MERRVVITAEGAITPLGNDKERIFENLTKGVSGVKALRSDDLLYNQLNCKVFGTVTEEVEYDFKRRFRKTLGPVGYYACKVAEQAIKSSGLDQAFISSGRMGVAFGSTHGSPTIQRDIYWRWFGESAGKMPQVGAADYLKSMVHTTAANIAKMFQITGRVISSCTACTTSSQSIGFGYEAIKYGLQDAMLCGAADEYDTTTVAVFDQLLACSTEFNETPHMTPRPFDRRRDGLVVGEGAGAVLLEELSFARKRGADILAEVIGFACNDNGGDLILPNLEGIRQVIRVALRNAGISPDEVDLISAHGTATRMGDVLEAQAIASEYGNRPPIVALKSYTGHTMGTCGVIETMCVLSMMEKGVIVPTLNLDEVDERCAMINHVTSMREEAVRTAAVQNFAFGGVNTCLFVKKLD